MLPKVISSNIEEINVLHVDDDPNQFEFIKHFLTQADEALKVTCVSTPDEVFRELETGNFDCLVTDFQMPLMDGIELATKVREKHALPIILYTGQGSEEVAEAAFTVGIDDYIRKEMDPSHYKVLGKRILDAVEKHRIENLYRNVIEQTRDAISIIINDRLIFCNKSTLDLFDVNDISELPTNIFGTELKSQGLSEIKLENSNKTPMYIETSTNPIIYNGREALLCFARDITDKKNLELSNQTNQERFKKLVDLVPDGIISINPLGYITFVNDTYLKLTGYEKHEILDRHLTKLGSIRRRDLLKHVKTFATIIKGNIPPPIEFHWTHKDGTPCIGEAYITLIEILGRKEILMIAKDITNEKRRQNEYETRFKKGPDAIIELDKNGAIISINDMALEYSELSKQDSIGNHINTVYQIVEGEIELDSIFQNSTRHRKIDPFEIKLKTSSNNSVWVEGHPSILEVDDEVYGCQIVFLDVTERKLVELRRKQYTKKLEQIIMENNVTSSPINLGNVKTELT